MLHEDAIKAVREYLKEKTDIRTHYIGLLDYSYQQKEYIVEVIISTVTDVAALYNANITHDECLGKRGLFDTRMKLYIPEDEIRRVQLRIAKQKDVFRRTKE